MLEKMKGNIQALVKLFKDKVNQNLRDYFSNGPKALKSCIAFIVVILLVAVTAVFSTRKTIVVRVDNKVMKIVTYRSIEKDALAHNNILVGPKDKVQPSLSTEIKDGDKIYIKKAVNVNIAVDGKLLKIKSAENNIASMLKAEGITLSKIDKIKPAKSSKIKSGMKILITRVNSQIVKSSEDVGFATEVITDNTMGNDEKNIIQQGQAGVKETETKIVYEDGKAVSKNIISEVLSKLPIKQIVRVGTLGVLKPDRGGKVLYKSSVGVVATAYTNDFGFGITASGTRVKRSVDGYSSVAVDPRVIPLGTRLYIPGYGYGIAEDTGGAIKGNRVDLFFSSESDCYNWGVKDIKVYILK
ncbi:G5 and 3D domain-containing protein [Clostridium hydrogenum]|uniref:G5 and 3D domain-containing protein n=1 Tax=Clostridium hydrogenum TaxID=2855764 RepID=UPI001EEC5C5C|nr:G5 and 3D domain-containing protein [Clostridium hydrogenum]